MKIIKRFMIILCVTLLIGVFTGGCVVYTYGPYDYYGNTNCSPGFYTAPMYYDYGPRVYRYRPYYSYPLYYGNSWCW